MVTCLDEESFSDSTDHHSEKALLSKQVLQLENELITIRNENSVKETSYLKQIEILAQINSELTQQSKIMKIRRDENDIADTVIYYIKLLENNWLQVIFGAMLFLCSILYWLIFGCLALAGDRENVMKRDSEQNDKISKLEKIIVRFREEIKSQKNMIQHLESKIKEES